MGPDTEGRKNLQAITVRRARPAHRGPVPCEITEQENFGEEKSTQNKKSDPTAERKMKRDPSMQL
jgi:hypothetical protein